MFYHFILMNNLVIKISRHISIISIHFWVLQILSKTKLVFLSNLIFQHMNRDIVISLFSKLNHVCINTSNIHRIKVNLFWSTIHENQNPNHETCVYVHLSISTILSFTNGSKHTKLNYGYLSLLDDLHLQVDFLQNSIHGLGKVWSWCFGPRITMKSF